MKSLQIEQLVMEHFITWQGFDKTRTARANRDFIPPTEGVWLRIHVVGGISQIASVSHTPCVLYTGTVVVQLFERENSGTKTIKQQADSLALHLNCVQLAGLELLAASIINVGTDDGFYQINVSVPYRFIAH